MSKHTLPLYALTKITETEGLEDGKYDLIYRRNYHRVIYPHTFQGGCWVDLPDEFEEAVYLRPLPEGTVAVSEEELLKISEWMNDVGREQNHYQIFKGVTLNVKLLLQLYKKGLKPVDALNDLSTIC